MLGPNLTLYLNTYFYVSHDEQFSGTFFMKAGSCTDWD